MLAPQGKHVEVAATLNSRASVTRQTLRAQIDAAACVDAPFDAAARIGAAL